MSKKYKKVNGQAKITKSSRQCGQVTITWLPKEIPSIPMVNWRERNSDTGLLWTSCNRISHRYLETQSIYCTCPHQKGGPIPTTFYKHTNLWYWHSIKWRQWNPLYTGKQWLHLVNSDCFHYLEKNWNYLFTINLSTVHISQWM